MQLPSSMADDEDYVSRRLLPGDDQLRKIGLPTDILERHKARVIDAAVFDSGVGSETLKHEKTAAWIEHPSGGLRSAQ